MWVLRYGSILNKPRSFISNKSKIFKELLNCSLCLGFWCGVLHSVLLYYLNTEITICLLLPFSCCASCWFFDSLLDLIQISSNHLDKK